MSVGNLVSPPTPQLSWEEAAQGTPFPDTDKCSVRNAAGSAELAGVVLLNDLG